jgi:hypothetical protein
VSFVETAGSSNRLDGGSMGWHLTGGLGLATIGQTWGVGEAYMVVIVRGGGAGFAQDVVVDGRHRVTADEPAAAGGTDTGPTPYDYLLVALGT